MNKEVYLQELEKALRARNVADVSDILQEYEQHFDFKLGEGFSEEEIANKLEAPKIIAAQFPGEHQQANVPVRVGLTFLAIFGVMVLVIMYGLILVFAAFSITVFALGICLIGDMNIAELIPTIPYIGGLMLGISFIGLAVVSTIATIWCYLYANQLVKAYIQWHKNTVMGCGGHRSFHPEISPCFRQWLKRIAIVAGIAGGVMLCVGLFYMFAYTDFKPFWHELNWFQ